MKSKLEDEVIFIMEIDNLKKELEEKNEKIKQLKQDNEKLRESLDGKENIQIGVQEEFIEKSKMYDDANIKIESLENDKKQLQVDFQRLEKKLKSETEEIQKEKKELEAKYEKQGEALKEKDQYILNLKGDIGKLNDIIKEDVAPIKKELSETKNKLNELENELKNKNEILKETESKLREISFKLDSKKDNFEREIQSLKSIHDKEIEKLKSKFTSEISDIKKQGEMPSYYLKYHDKAFIRSISKPMGTFMLLDSSKEIWILDISNESNIIEKKTAERLARSIATSGWVEGGKRIGVKYKLEIKE